MSGKYQQMDNTGTLGKNKERKDDKSSEYRGKAIIGGVEYWINGWVKENRTTGEKFFSLTFKMKGGM